MAGSVFSVISDRFVAAASWLIGMSPVSLPIYASSTLLSLAELPEGAARAVPRAFYFWLVVSVGVTFWLSLQLYTARKRMALSVLTAPEESRPIED
jgi:hypothetical protein